MQVLLMLTSRENPGHQQLQPLLLLQQQESVATGQKSADHKNNQCKVLLTVTYYDEIAPVNIISMILSFACSGFTVDTGKRKHVEEHPAAKYTQTKAKNVWNAGSTSWYLVCDVADINSTLCQQRL